MKERKKILKNTGLGFWGGFLGKINQKVKKRLNPSTFLWFLLRGVLGTFN